MNIIIKTHSWGYKLLLKKYEDQGWSEPNFTLQYRHKTICQFWRAVCWILFKKVLIILGWGWLAAFIVWFNVDMLYYIFTNEYLHDNEVTSAAAPFFIVEIAIGILAMIGLAFQKFDLAKKFATTYTTTNQFIKSKFNIGEPNIFTLWMKAIHEKTCSLINYDKPAE
ncbi:MAG TPA: hypothetical protein VJ201_04455 [Candidatus Babeliales bacterium]|nr:hypothetical protein [Candidatus Babeliales bacterium]